MTHTLLSERNTRKFVHKDGAFYKEGAVVVPDVQAIKIKKMKDLQDSAFAGHGGFRTVKNVHYLHW